MQAIILAAGKGSRLNKYTKENTKCLLKVNGETLLERMIRALKKAGIKKLIMVVGYKKENVKKYVQEKIKDIEVVFIDNDDYEITNNIYSLYLAKEYLKSKDTILLESDLIFEEDIIKDLVKSPYQNVAVVAKYKQWMDGTTVLIDQEDNIKLFIEKEDLNYLDIDKHYKTVNIYKFSQEFSQNFYLPFLEAYIKTYGKNNYYELVLKVIAQLKNSNLKAFKLENQVWYEIDDSQDLDIASTIFSKDQDLLNNYSKRYGGYWRFENLKDFCYLVNPYFPTNQMKKKMISFFDELLINYPSSLKVQNICATRMFDNIEEDYLIIGNGASELINLLKYVLKGSIGGMIPTFNEYLRCFLNHEMININMEEDNYEFKVDKILKLIKEVDNFILVNPNNPTGSFLKYNDLIMLLETSKKYQTRIIIDESFVDFAEAKIRYTLINNDLLNKYKNLIVIKSIGKSYGVPGLRLGVLATSDQEVISILSKSISIWNINSFAEYFLQIMGIYKKDFLIACNKIVTERKRFKKKLKELKELEVYKSEANYIMCKLKGIKAQNLAEYMLKENKIFIKVLTGKEGFKKGEYIRIAIKEKNDNDFFLSSLKEFINYRKKETK
ncbi:MAG: aminotransferase class I/II-fold pyridoxal phosphate-dependent enzyme [Bacilli bacterium]|jgi:histidinol-phosphate/aromatic aminotransferase/cobyric acid decarboxylase-like protein/choline kinase